MAANVTRILGTIGGHGVIDAALDADGNSRRAFRFGSALDIDIDDDDIFYADEAVSSTTTWDLTAMTMGGATSADHTGDTVKMFVLEYVSGTGSVSFANAASTGLSAGIGAVVIDAARTFAIVRHSVVVGASTHDVTATVTGSIVFKIACVGKAA